jgi:hypothetical protein
MTAWRRNTQNSIKARVDESQWRITAYGTWRKGVYVYTHFLIPIFSFPFTLLDMT